MEESKQILETDLASFFCLFLMPHIVLLACFTSLIMKLPFLMPTDTLLHPEVKLSVF